MDSSATSGLSTGQLQIYNRFKNATKVKCFKCSGTNTLPAAFGDPEADYKAVESKGVLKYGGKSKLDKNSYCKTCSAYI